MLSVVAIGNVLDVNVFSGTPFYFYEAGKRLKLADEGWRLDLNKLTINRYIWNAGQLLTGKRSGGFQYSDEFHDQLLKQVPVDFLAGDIISFNQFFPRAEVVKNAGGRIFYYIDATFAQLLDRYEVNKIINERNIRRFLDKEKLNFQKADGIAAFQHWACTSVLDDYKISAEKVKVIHPGANLTPADIININVMPAIGRLGIDTPLVLGFIGKDWKRKGLAQLFGVMNNLNDRGYKLKIHCAGGIDESIRSHANVKYAGFIDKNKNKQQFLDFISSCHMGCLFSQAEFSSISVLEFLQAGKPLAGYAVDGMVDLFQKDYSLVFNPEESVAAIADRFASFLDMGKYDEYRQAAIANAGYFRWDRAVKEWEQWIKR